MGLHECAAWIRENDSFLLLTHRRPDGDTLGSAAALCHALKRLGKQAWLYRNPEVTERYEPFVASYYAPADFRPAYFIALDIADVTMLPKGFDGSVDLVLDHHGSNSQFGLMNEVRPEAAACGELILDLIPLLCGNLEKEEADLLYVAVSTDTGCFCYGNTTADTFRAAAELYEAGADNRRLNKLLFRTSSRPRLMLEGMIYTGLRSARDGAVNVAVVTLDMMSRAGATEDDCDDIASLAGRVAGNRVSVTVREMEPGRCKVSLRTDGVLDASAACARFGGGGHRMAAGCELSATPEKTVTQMLSVIDELWG
ncbi:MAG: bifunctional oligoribonuclease/PAP phosphatase NrnA [Eubacteriales bacterium]|nr:bifunctional oligoribonuclease/PAP phosphatase NrnA [Eubacteriales bacterium]